MLIDTISKLQITVLIENGKNLGERRSISQDDHRRTKPQTSCRKESRLYYQLPQSQHPSSDPNNDDSNNLLNSKSLVCAGAFGATTARSVATTTCRACAGARAGGCTGAAPTTDTDSDCTAGGTRTGGPTTTACSAYTGTFVRTTTTTTTRRIILNKDIKRRPDVNADLIAVGFRQLGRLLEISTSTFLVDCLDESGAEGVGVLAEAGVLVDEREGEAAGGEISIQEGLDADGKGGELGC